jgi:dual specificity MAP kinase phosphatase
MMKFLNKLKSYALVALFFYQRVYDNVYRHIHGLPTLRRSQITANLFLGSQYSPVGLEKLKALGVTAIVNMREHDVYEEARYEGIKYLHLSTVDNTPPSLEILMKGANFVDEEIKNGGKVYIHCRQGLGRGPTMTIAYLIKTGLTYEDAFTMVKKVRTFINPRPAQIARLKELEQFLETHKTKVPAA